jgi:hypothetical protein
MYPLFQGRSVHFAEASSAQFRTLASGDECSKTLRTTCHVSLSEVDYLRMRMIHEVEGPLFPQHC